MSEKISVIVPVYNVEQYLEKCINSIINQIYKNLEIILIDDGSTDNSGKICDECLNKDPRIIVVHKENGGISSARNEGIKRAAGEFISFIDSDDYIDADMIQELYDHCKKYDCQIGVCQYHVVGENVTERVEIFDEKKILSGYAALDELVKGNIKSYAWNKLYKKSLFQDIKFPEGRTYEDIYIMHQLFLKCSKIVWISNRAYYYVQRKGSIMHQWSIQNSVDNYWALRKRLNDLTRIGYGKSSRLYADLIRVVLYLEVTRKKASNNEKRKCRKKIKELYQDFQSLEIKEEAVKKELSANENFKYRIYQKSKFLYRNLVGRAYEGKFRKYAERYISDKRNKKQIEIMREKDSALWIIGLPEYNNLGDCAIGYATICFLKNKIVNKDLFMAGEETYLANARQIHKKIHKDDVIVLQGGGNIGDMYETQQLIREKALKKCRKNQIVIFPQTVFFSETQSGQRALKRTRQQYLKCANLTLLVREQYSYQYVKENFKKLSVAMVPDIVFSLVYKEQGERDNRVLVCIRNDMESLFGMELFPYMKQELIKTGYQISYTDTVADADIGVKAYEREVTEKLDEFSKSKLIVTDRLHGVIFAAITGTPCIALDNYNYKIRGICNWLSDLNYIQYIKDMDGFSNAIHKLSHVVPDMSGLQRLRDAFEKITILKE